MKEVNGFIISNRLWDTHKLKIFMKSR